MPLWQLPSNVDDWPVDGLQALEETINIAREAGIRVVASHHKARGRSSFGRSGHDTLVVNAARDEGLEVYLDVYPYETFGGGARPMIPKWSLVHDTVDTSGGRDSPVYNRPGIYDDARARLERRWNDPATRELISRDIAWIVDHNGGAERVVVLRYPDEAFVGKTLAELATERGGTFQDVVVHMALNGFPNMIGGARTRGYGIHDVDVVNYYRQEYTATASDAGVAGGGDPFAAVRCASAAFGAFTRKIARYVKDLNAISLPFAVRSMTGLPARIIGLEDRGLLREGYKADSDLRMGRFGIGRRCWGPICFSWGGGLCGVRGGLLVEMGGQSNTVERVGWWWWGAWWATGELRVGGTGEKRHLGSWSRQSGPLLLWGGEEVFWPPQRFLDQGGLPCLVHFCLKAHGYARLA